jgi:hypothetical protein
LAVLDQLDLTNVENAFAEIGVPIKDESGNFKTLYEVIEDANSKWAYLTEEQQQNIIDFNKEVFK